MEVKIKPRLLLVVTVTLFVVFLASVLLHNKNLDTSHLWTYALLEKGSSAGTEDDPEARERYDQMRFCNPRTGEIPENMRQRELRFVSEMIEAQKVNINARQKSNLDLPLVWQHRGPFTVGPRTRAIAIDKANECHIFTGAVSGGLWESWDCGRSWTRISSADRMINISAITQDPRPGKGSTWYVGTQESSGSSRSNSEGLFKSTDNGATWVSLPGTSATPIQTSASFSAVIALAVHPTITNADVVLAATSAGIMRSADGGQTWARTLGTTSFRLHHNLAVTSQGIIYATAAGTQGGIFRSSDGVTWSNISPSFQKTAPPRASIAIAPSDESQVYFFIARGNEHDLFHYQHNSSGGVWTDRSSVITQIREPSFTRVNTQSGYSMFVSVHPANPSLVFLGGIYLYRSTDGFSSLANVSMNTEPHVDHHGLVFFSSDPNFALNINDGGVYLADIAAWPKNWRPINNNYAATQFYSVAIRTEGASQAVAGGTQDNGTHMQPAPGLPWSNVMGADGGYAAFNDSLLYTSIQNAAIVVNTWKGDKLEQKFVFNGSALGGVRFIHPFFLDPSDKNVMFTTVEKQVWRNNKLDQLLLNPPLSSWESLSLGSVDYDALLAIGISSQKPTHRVYMAARKSSDLLFYRYEKAHVSDYDGPHFCGKIPAQAFTFVNQIKVDPDNGNELFAVISNYEQYSLYRSVDAGSNWQKVAGNLEENSDGTGNGPALVWLEIAQVGDRKVYFVGTSTGLFATEQIDGENTHWEKIALDQIGNSAVDMIASRNNTFLVAVATHGSGIFTATLNESLSQVSVQKELHFGFVDVGSSFTKDVRIENNYSEALKLDSVQNPIGFKGSTGSNSIMANSTLKLAVSFNPVTPESYAGELRLFFNGATSPLTVYVTGSGSSRELKVQDTLSFNTVGVNQTRVLVLPLTNNGNGPLTITKLEYPEGFTGAASASILPKSAYVLPISFQPTEAKEYKGSLVITSNGSSVPIQVDLSGRGGVITGLKEALTNQIIAYPNPVNDELFLYTELPDLQFYLINSNGQLIHSGNLPQRSNRSVSVKNLVSGMYYVQFRSNRQLVHVSKVIVAH
jgi:photosystem II stability/assembly factor-like uncharacterized protein